VTPAENLGYQPAELVPPGETLQEWLDREGMTQAEFAKRTSLTPKHINQVIKGGAGISPEVALAFEHVTAIPAPYWTQLDADYQTAKQRTVEAEALGAHADLVDRFPIRELERRNCIEHRTSKIDKLMELLRFFAVADPAALEEVWLRPVLCRRSSAFKADEGAIASWLRIAQRQASNVKTRPFDATAATAAIDEMRTLSAMQGIEWLGPLTKLCASVGIALVILKELPRCRINGATDWLSPKKAMVVLSLRHRRNDIFWFTLFHELCHVLRHSKKETFVDTKGSGISQRLEGEADNFARRNLIPPQLAGALHNLSTAIEVEGFARTIGIAPGIVVGRMQHDGLIPHSQWTDLIERYRFSDD
jgi:HTH-type transcriptional regulator / antitoxin HigA